jgi:glutathione-regulated potassium-efflux system ancillary protein KefG
MLKAYMDEVLTYGFAYGSGGDKLNGKKFKAAVTIGGADYSYQAGGWNNFSMTELLRPLQQMANLTGMLYTRAFLLYGTAAMQDDELQASALAYRKELEDTAWDDGLTKYLRAMDPENVQSK